MVEPRLDGAHGVGADQLFRLAERDPRQARSPLEKRVRGDVDTRKDDAAEVLAGGGEGVEGDGGAEIHHHRGPAVFLEGSHGVGDAVGPHLLRIVVVNADAGLDAGPDEQRSEVEIALRQLGHRAVKGGHHRADDDSVNLAGVDAGQLQQVTRHEAVAVHGLLVIGHQAPVGQQPFTLVHAQQGVGVVDVNNQQHSSELQPLHARRAMMRTPLFFYSRIHFPYASRMSPASTGTVLPSASRRTSKQPVGSSPAVTPLNSSRAPSTRTCLLRA